VPTLGPTDGSINPAEELRIFLIAEWPSLEEDLAGFTTPQFFAFDWLANDPNLAEYTDQRKLQRFALATLYFSTDGDNWRRNDGWLSEENECLWYTASSASPCDDNFSYKSLDLDLNGLSGTIPTELVLLSNSLSRIDLSSRGGTGAVLTGSIPAELGFLSLLQSVNLSGNQLQGSLPVGVGKWNRILSLNVNGNILSGTLPFSIVQWGSLVSLDLGNNKLEGSIPTYIGVLTNLRSMDVSNNLFTGSLPTEIGQVDLLQFLYLQDNRFTKIPSEMGNLFLLQQFFAQNNELGGTIPLEIGNLINLLNLDLSNNSLTGTLPYHLGNMISIRDQLNLSGNSLSGRLPDELGRLIFVRNMLLQSNALTGPVPTSFSRLSRLNTLRLEDNFLTGTVPTEVCAVYSETYPVFVTDCSPPGAGEIVCDCCMFCCEDGGGCECQFAGTDLSFLCAEFRKSPGLEDRIFGNIMQGV
jgi:hypothetical protein